MAAATATFTAQLLCLAAAAGVRVRCTPPCRATPSRLRPCVVCHVSEQESQPGWTSSCGAWGMLAMELATCTPAYWPTPPDQRTIRHGGCGARRALHNVCHVIISRLQSEKVFPARIKHFGVKKLKSCNFVCSGKARLESPCVTHGHTRYEFKLRPGPGRERGGGTRDKLAAVPVGRL